MLKNLFCILILILFFFALIAGITKKDSNTLQENSNEEIDTKEEAGEVTTEAKIEEIHYEKDGIEASYPQIISDGSEKDIKQWNEIISSDFQKILQIYSFYPILGPTPPPTAVVPTILKIQNEVKLNSDRFFSVVYTAAYNSPYSAHPTQLFYTTNIDKQRNLRLRLPEIITINEEFIKAFRGWEMVPIEVGNKELNQAASEYLDSITDEELLSGFLAADQIGSDNIWGIYSYMTPDHLGISISAPNYIGDHLELEQDYSKVLKYLKRT